MERGREGWRKGGMEGERGSEGGREGWRQEGRKSREGGR